jgi:hypothetical protein
MQHIEVKTNCTTVSCEKSHALHVLLKTENGKMLMDKIMLHNELFRLYLIFYLNISLYHKTLRHVSVQMDHYQVL